MADSNDSASERGRDAASDTGMAGGIDRVKSIGSEVAGEIRNVAGSLIDEQKERAAGQIAGVADVLRRAAESLEGSQAQSIAQYAGDTAGRIDDFARSLRERPWSDLLAEIEDFARRQPALFLVGSVVLGIAAGRFLTASSEHQSVAAPQIPSAAGDSGGGGTGSRRTAASRSDTGGYGAGVSGVRETL
ncbi:MAG: hypothetical protein JO267_02835 [Alphaproteobacteria bacterium]|nr:hypothetical protein [Alphaproteobacteria bacterium]MBV9861064.1 hypothetical protein [Alphaproteobacteria bacterium]